MTDLVYAANWSEGGQAFKGQRLEMEWERVEGRGPEGAASRQSAAAVSDKWSAGVSAFTCPSAEDIMITRGVSHRRLRDISWAVVFWDSPPSAGAGDEMTYNLLPSSNLCSLYMCEQTNTSRRRRSTPLQHERKMMAWMMYCAVIHYKHGHAHTGGAGEKQSNVNATVIQPVCCTEREWTAEKE